MSLSCSCYCSSCPPHIPIVLSHSQIVLLVDLGPFSPSSASCSCCYYTSVLYPVHDFSHSISFTPRSLCNFSLTTRLDPLWTTSCIIRHHLLFYFHSPTHLGVPWIEYIISSDPPTVYTLGPHRSCPVRPIIVSSTGAHCKGLFRVGLKVTQIYSSAKGAQRAPYTV